MNHNFKAKLKKLRYGVYTYGRDVTAPLGWDRTIFHKSTMRKYESDNLSVSVPRSARTTFAEKRIAKMLASLKPGFSDAVLIVAPFPLSSLTALLLIKTEKPARISYTVKGIRGSQDFTTGETGYSTSHRVPIVALFENTLNRVVVSIEDKDTGNTTSKTLRIKIPEVLDSHFGILMKKTFEKPELANEPDRFFEVSGGYRGATSIFDTHANLRGFLSRKPQYYGIFPLEKGHYLFSEHYLKRSTFGAPLSVFINEMDWLGRCHHTYWHPIGYHHHAVELPDGNFLTISSSFTDSFVENTVIKIDRETGEEIDSISMNDLFDDTYKTRPDWAHVNSISPTDNPDEIVLSLRNIHSIIRVNIPQKKLIWIFSHPDMFKDTPQADLVLTPEGEIDPWFFQQHSAKIITDYPDADPNRLYITFYDNHDSKRRPVDWFDKPGTAYGLIVSIDETARTVRLEKRFPTSYAITRANTYFDAEKRRFFTMDARLEKQTEEVAADMREWDFDTGELLREITFSQDFFAIHPFTFDIDELSKPLDPDRRPIRGELYNPSPCETPEGLKNAKPIEERDDVKQLVLFGDVLGIWGIDQELSEIILVGKKGTWHIDYEDVAEGIKLNQPIASLQDFNYYHLMPLLDLPADIYKIYQKVNGEYYNSNRSVKIK